MEYLDTAPILREVFQDFSGSIAPGGAVEWRLDVPSRLPLILVNPARLRQVLLNLLSNAARHSEKGCVELGAALEPGRLHMTVRDTGGIRKPGDRLDRLRLEAAGRRHHYRQLRVGARARRCGYAASTGFLWTTSA